MPITNKQFEKQFEKAKSSTRRMTITGLQADLLLFAFDNYIKAANKGEIKLPPGYSKKDVLKLREELFAAHEHPPEKASFAALRAPKSVQKTAKRLGVDLPSIDD